MSEIAEMQMAISIDNLNDLVAKQLNNLFQFEMVEEGEVLKKGILESLRRSEVCFAGAVKKSKYFSRNGAIYFNPFHSVQYAIFLYYLSNSIAALDKDFGSLADRIYYLNKSLNGLDLFYEVEMPNVFYFDHPVGSVMGRAKYGELFSFAQCCTVGNNKGNYPVLGRNVQMFPGSKIVGDCRIGDCVVLSANSYIIDTDIPSFSLVFGESPNLTVKKMNESYFDTF